MSPPTQYSSPTLGEKKPTQSIVVEGYDVTPVASETSGRLAFSAFVDDE